MTLQQDETYTKTILHAFQGGADGNSPDTELLLGSDGSIFGTTFDGGSTYCPSGCGTVFEIAADGTYTVLHAFQGGPDGIGPGSPLFWATDGNIYGTTILNFYSKKDGYSGGGTIFALKPSAGGWTYAVVKDLNNPYQPRQPAGPLAQSSDGRLFGTFRDSYLTRGGLEVRGAVASLTLQPVGGRPAYTLGATQKFGPASGLDLSSSDAGLSEDVPGNLYGAAAKSSSENPTTIFRFTPNTLPQADGRFNRLYTFKQDSISLGNITGLTVDATGVVFGTASLSGVTVPFGPGGIFKLTPPTTPDGRYTETDVYRFTGGADGRGPNGRLVIDAKGNLYGTTNQGGLGYGVVYRITP